MQANYVQRIRFIFSKVGPTRYIGHLDLARTLERSLNRARIPLAYTQGYNPRPRLQLASALPLGYTSDSEIADIWLLEQVQPETVAESLESKIAPGLHLQEIFEVDLSEPALQTQVREAAYQATPLEVQIIEDLDDRIKELISSDEVIRERRGKQYDLRPLILDLYAAEDDGGRPIIQMRLMQQPAKTGRPDEVLAALGLVPADFRFHRTELILADAAVTEA
jgi:radical SAM-linked protein